MCHQYFICSPVRAQLWCVPGFSSRAGALKTRSPPGWSLRTWVASLLHFGTWQEPRMGFLCPRLTLHSQAVTIGRVLQPYVSVIARNPAYTTAGSRNPSVAQEQVDESSSSSRNRLQSTFLVFRRFELERVWKRETLKSPTRRKWSEPWVSPVTLTEAVPILEAG